MSQARYNIVAAAAIAILAIPGISRADNFVAKGDWMMVARGMQIMLPQYAVDGLIEAERGSETWAYRLIVDRDKLWYEELRVTVKFVDASSADMKVEVYRVERGLVKSRPRLLAQQSSEWTERLRSLLGTAGASKE